MTGSVTQKFIDGPRLIDGSDLNTLVRQINAALGGTGGTPVNTAIATVGNGTLTAASIVGGVITRSGSTSAFTDTTDTAANIVAAITSPVAGESFFLYIRNTTAFAETFAGGTGVTLSGNVILPAHSTSAFLVTLTSLTAVAMLMVGQMSQTTVAPELATALTTNGAGTITGAGIAGGVTLRSGTSAAVTDTTDTAANIIAARANVAIGDSWEYTYTNTAPFNITLAGGTGVTITGVAAVAANANARFLVTYTAAATITMVGISSGSNVEIPASQYSTAAGQSTALTGVQVAGANFVVYDNTGTTPANLQMATAAQIVAAIPNAQIGFAYTLQIRNSSGSANTATITTNTGITLTGTMTIAQSVTRTFIVTLVSLSAVTVQSVGISAAGV